MPEGKRLSLKPKQCAEIAVTTLHHLRGKPHWHFRDGAEQRIRASARNIPCDHLTADELYFAIKAIVTAETVDARGWHG